MIPVEHPMANMVYRGNGADVADLHCQRRDVEGGGTAIFSVWKPSDEERAAIAAGANVEIGIWYVEPIPPVSVGVSYMDEGGFVRLS